MSLEDPTWPEDQLGHEYCAQIADLTFYDNCLDIGTEPAPASGRTRVRIGAAASPS